MGDWGKWGTDWNHNGKYDLYDSSLDYEIFKETEEKGYCHSGSGSGSAGEGGIGQRIFVIAGIIILLIIIFS